jgi:hypothetical protein
LNWQFAILASLDELTAYFVAAFNLPLEISYSSFVRFNLFGHLAFFFAQLDEALL